MINDKTPSPCPLTQTQYSEFSVHCAVRKVSCTALLSRWALSFCKQWVLWVLSRKYGEAGWESCQVLPDARRSTYRSAVTARKKRTMRAGWRGDTQVSKYLDATLSAVPSTAIVTDVLVLWVGDSPGSMTPPTQVGSVGLCLGGGWREREWVEGSQGLTWMLLSLLILFYKMMCVHRHVQWFQR